MTGEPVLAFADVMRRLRVECPWKAAQTHASLARYLLEEAYEAAEAMDLGDSLLLREELGDVLLQVFLHAAIAEQSGDFTLDDVARDVTAKMVRRTPHVFAPDVAEGDSTELTPAEVNEEWERRKAVEKSSRASVFDGIPAGLPALLLADKVLERLGRAGAAPVPTSSSVTGQDGVGDRLLALVAEARAAGQDPEQELREAVRRLVADHGTG